MSSRPSRKGFLVAKPLSHLLAKNLQHQKFPSFTYEGNRHQYLDFKIKFLEFCDLQGYDEEVAKIALRKSMRGKALRRTSSILHDCSFLSLLVKYDAVFAKVTPALLGRIELETIHQDSGESLLLFHQRILASWTKGYPHWEVDKNIIPKFTHGIRRPDLRSFMEKANPSTYDQALTMAETRLADLTKEDEIYSSRRLLIKVAIKKSTTTDKPVVLEKRETTMESTGSPGSAPMDSSPGNDSQAKITRSGEGRISEEIRTTWKDPSGEVPLYSEDIGRQDCLPSLGYDQPSTSKAYQ
jgi:hypothetical protein